jgi:large subunit ribosomal protein L18
MSKLNVKDKRFRRAGKTRARIRFVGISKLVVHRSPRHIYAQIVKVGGAVVASASTRDKEVKKSISYGGNIKAATEIGKLIATRAKEKGVVEVAFDRAGYRYHGRVKALAEAARKNGLKF